MTRITRMSQADKSGLQPGDLIIRINGTSTPDLETFKSVFESVDWGEDVNLDVFREGRELTAKMVLKQ